MATFETLPRFEQGWRQLTRQQQATFRKVVLEAFEPDLTAPGRRFRPSLRVREISGCSGVFEMTWGDNGWATFSYGDSPKRSHLHVTWRQIGIFVALSSQQPTNHEIPLFEGIVLRQPVI